MTLRIQLNIRIFLASCCILTLAGSIAVWQARNAVREEVESSIHLALQLTVLNFSRVSGVPSETSWYDQLNALKQTRHLTVQLKKTTGQTINFSHDNPINKNGKKPPQWFIDLIDAEYPKVEHQIIDTRGEKMTLVIMANPLDEIREVWQESLAFFSSISILILFTFFAIQRIFNKAIKTTRMIVDTLKTIETGQYHHKLPEFSIKEYDSIAKAINHLADELEKAQLENRALAQHSLEIQEDERQRMSQELHDELGQSLTAIKVMAVAATRDQSDLQKITSSIISICDHLMKIVRSMMHQLHPLILKELGLKAALEDLVNYWSERNPRTELNLQCANTLDELDPKMAIQIFRIIQECLTNISRHAEALRVDIIVCVDCERQKMLKIHVVDNGKGCNMDNHSSGFGLLGIRERIKSLGGAISFQSEPNRGMVVIASIPIQ